MVCTVSQLRAVLEGILSPARLAHCEGVARTMEGLFDRYGWPPEDLRAFRGMGVCPVVGLMHDAGRELPEAEALAYARRRHLALEPEMLRAPVLAHGIIAHAMALEILGPDVPEPWLRAMDWHTTGDVRMGWIGMALFVADYLEPGRRFLDQEARNRYLQPDDMNEVASSILSDSIAHWKEKGYVFSKSSEALAAFWRAGGRIGPEDR